MAHIIILFNLHYHGTYSDRYNALRSRVKEIAIGEAWKETTSSYVAQYHITLSASCCLPQRCKRHPDEFVDNRDLALNEMERG